MMSEEIDSAKFKSFEHAFSALLASSNHKDIVDALLEESLKRKASDINIEPTSSEWYDIFFRICGVLHKVMAVGGVQAVMLREALRRGTQGLKTGSHGVVEGYLLTQLHGATVTFTYYDIPQSPNNSILIKNGHNDTPHISNVSKTVSPARNIDKKVFIWQVGKVGSSTVYRSLIPHSKPSVWSVPSIQRGDSHWPIHNNIIQTHSLKLLYEFLHYSEEEFVVVSLVRDILARNISALFQSMNDKEEGRNEYYIATVDEFQKMSFEEQEFLITRHLRRLNTSNAVTSWYDNILKSHLYYPDIEKYFIDIYAKPFDQKNGFQVYESKTPRVKMIILRLEDLNEQKNALGDFLGVDRVELISGNVANEKWYNQIYQRFKARYQPTMQEIDFIYNSNFMKYFYSPEQIRNFSSKWCKYR